jgi:diacylglycerol O-acyltransferase / wax synthase
MRGVPIESLPLTREDRAILALERGTVVGHICKVLVTDSAGLDADALRRGLAERIAAAPMLRRRLGRSAGAPIWETVDDLDLDAHVVDMAGAPPLDRFALYAAVAAIFSRRLDRSRPLWQLDVVGPLANGGAALVWRIHHALADGRSSMRLLEDVLWDAAPPVPPRMTAPPQGNATRHGQWHSTLGFARREFADRHGSPFDGTISATRDIAFAAAPLHALHDAARRHGEATVNDAVLAVVAGGLRRWIERRHGSLGTVRVRVPVSLHQPGDGAGNRDSYFGVDLPLHERDPLARLSAIHAETAECKADHDAQTMDVLLRDLARISPRLERLCQRVEGSPRAFALAVSNVPGPRRAVSVLGVPVRELNSLAEIGERHALRVTAVSLAETLHFGLCADPAIVPDVVGLADDLAAEADALISI